MPETFAGTATTNGVGNATFAFGPPFASVPSVALSLGPAGLTPDLFEARVVTLTAALCVVAVRNVATVAIGGVSVLASPPAPVAGVQVNLMAAPLGRVR